MLSFFIEAASSYATPGHSTLFYLSANLPDWVTIEGFRFVFWQH